MRPVPALAGLACLILATGVAAVEYNPARRQAAAAEVPSAVQRVIVKLRSNGMSTMQLQAKSVGGARIQSLAARNQVMVRRSMEIAPNIAALHLEPLSAGESPAETLARLRADPAIEFAEVDQRRYAHAVPNDPKYDGQWYLKNTEVSAIDATTAWDITTGSTGVVIAELDTGVRYEHPDLKRATGAGRLLPGYDFVAADPGGGLVTANDGNSRDADAADPGDWVSAADNSPFGNCSPADSSWHGTRVAGIIGALSNNGVGVTGIDWNAWILPVRVLGKCGGFDADILAGMRWAAGLHVNGVPDNPYPARVINMSLGSTGICPASYQSVIDELTAQGVLVVVSAGNEGGPVDAPANCDGAAAIAGLRHAGTKVGFSSLGPEIALGAPGGNCVNVNGGPCLFSIDTTSNDGTTTPGASIYTDQINSSIGTSFSAPIVSGIAGLMLAVNANLKAPQLIARLKEGAKRPFPTVSDTGTPPVCHIPAGSIDVQDTECSCTLTTCGAGMASASGALAAALRPIAAIAVTGSVSSGQDVTLDASGSAAACNRTVSSYEWTVVGGTSTITSGTNTATAHVDAPATDPFTVRVTITDDVGRQDTADVTVNPTFATTSAPSNAGAQACATQITIAQVPDPTPTPTPTPPPAKKKGGGGALDGLLLLASLLALMARSRIRWPAHANSMLHATLK